MLTELAAAENQLLRLLLRIAGNSALGLDARPAHRMAATVAAAFTTTQRMVDRVHRLGTGVRANPAVPAATRLAQADVDPVNVRQLTDRRPAHRANPAHF